MKNYLPLVHPAADNPQGVCHLLNDKPGGALTVIELTVRNHPGAMSHITGLFARRAFNLEAILCVPHPGGETSCMLLLVDNGPRLEQIERQLAKLHDVLALRHRDDLAPGIFGRLLSQTSAPPS